MKSLESNGFTLIEVILVLAITGGLLVIALQGFAGRRAELEFHSSVQQALQDVLGQRAQAEASINTSPTGGSDLAHVNEGIVIVFNVGSSTLGYYKLIGADPKTQPDDLSFQFDLSNNPPLPTSDPAIGSLSYGLYYTGYSTDNCTSIISDHYYLAFTRSRLDASLQTGGLADPTWASANYTAALPQNAVPATAVELCFADLDGRKASLNVTYATNSVTGSYY